MVRRLKSFIKDNHRLILYFIINMISLVLHLWATMVLTSKLSVGEYGNYSLVLSIAGLISLIGVSWTASSIIYVGVNEYNIHQSFKRTLSARLIIIGVFSVPIIIAIIMLKDKINNYLNLQGTGIILIYYFLSIFISTISNYFLAIHRQLSLTLLELLGSVILLLLFICNKLSPKEALMYNIISQATLILGLFFFKKEDLKLISFDKFYLKKVLSFSLAQLLGFIGGYIINYGGNIIINHYLTKEELGVFNLSFRLFTNISSLILLINTFYAPIIVNFVSNKDKGSIRHFYYRIRPICLVVFLMGTIVAVLLGPFFINLIFTSKYQASIKPFMILLLANLPLSIEVFYISLYNSLGKHLILQIAIIAQAAVTLAIMLWFVPTKGVYGAVWAIVITYYLKTIFSYFYLEKRIRHILTP